MPEPDVDRAVDYTFAQRRAAKGQAVLDLDEDPDRAARAVELGQATGVPPVVINNDLDDFERQHKAGAVGAILDENPELREWIARNPMASKIANDDWGPLSRLVQRVKDHMPDPSPIISETARGFAEGTGEALGASEPSLAKEYEEAPYYLRIHTFPGRAKMDLFMAMLVGAARGIHHGAAEAARQVGVSEEAAKRFGRGAAEFAEWKVQDIAAHGVVKPEAAEAFAYRLKLTEERIKPWTDQGKLPPVGVDHFSDLALAEKAKQDMVTIDEILDEADKSLAVERSPMTVDDLLRPILKDKTAAIPFEAAQRLYEKKSPEAGDGKLGDIEDFAEKYGAAARVGGGDIQIPLADWILKVPSEVRRELKKEFKPDPEGMNLEEAAKAEGLEIKPAEPGEIAGTLEDSVRRVAGTDQVNSLTPVLLEEGQPEAPLFGKMAIGLTKKDYDRFIRTIDRQSEAEKAWELKKAAEVIRRRNTKEWKEEISAMRPDVAFEVGNRPEWVAHDWFNDGVLRGATGERPKFDPEKMTPEQRKAIPKQFQKEGGSAPDDLARPAGFKTGDEMLDVMSRFYQEKGETPAGDYLKRIVEGEITRRMEAEHGKLKDITMAEAQDHATGITQMERLHETTIALAIKAKKTPMFTKESIRAAAKGEVGRRPIGDQSRDLYLKESGKYGRTMIEAFLKQDWNEAFRNAQAQYFMNLMANEAGKLLDRKARFEKLARKFSKATDPESFRGPLGGPYVPYIQQVLSQFGRRVGRTPEQINDAIAQGGYGTLAEFVESKKRELKDIEIPDFLEKPPKTIERMTGDQFDDFHNMLTQLDKHGRDEATVFRKDQAEDFEKIRDTMIEKLKTLGDVKIKIHKEPGDFKKLWDTYYPGSLTIESILNRWDRDNAMGVFNQYIVRPLVEASNSKDRMIRFYQEALRKAAGDIPDIHKMVENSLWVDPYTKLPLDMSKRNVLGILMYWGNPSSRRKLLEGYKVDEREALKWLQERTTKEDWDRAQNIGHIFKRLIGLADEMSMRVNGTPIKKIDIVPFDTIHGRYEGWYNPVQYEPLFPGRVPKDIAEQLKETEKVDLRGKRALEQSGYYRANTNQSYTKARTEYVAPTEMNMNIIPTRMKQMIHDIAFRPAIIQAAKFVYDPKWQTAVIHHYGKEYKDLFIPFLKDVANNANSAASLADTTIDYFRQNLIATLIGFNPHTVAKHGMTAGFNSLTEVGGINFAKAIGGLLRTNDETGNSNWRFAMDTSEELQRRTRNISHYMLHQPELSLQRMGLRETMVNLGSKPVAISDLLSSVPTWLAQYEKSIRENMSKADAIFTADRAVRRAHGSSSITNLPAIMRGNALARTFTSLYGFFSHMLQKQFELSWKGADAYRGIKTGDLSAAKGYAPQLIAGLVSYIIIPAVVEEMVTPYRGHEKDSWGTWAFKTMTGGLAASYVGPKDFVRSMINGGEAVIGMTSTFSKEGSKLVRDISKGKFDKKTAGETIRDTAIMVGLAKGWTNAQEGRALQFFQRWMMGVDRPREPWDWMHGFTTGRIDQPEYRRHR